MLIAFLLITTILVTFLHFGVAFYICDFFNISKSYTKLIYIISLLLPILYLASNILINFYQNRFLDIFYKYISIWMVIFLYILFATLLVIGYKFIEGQIANIFDLHVTRESGKMVAMLLYLIAILLNIYGVYNSTTTKIVNRDVYIKNLPEVWIDKTAVLVADTHYGRVFNYEHASKTVAIINSLDSDYLFFVGDFYDGPRMDYASVANPYKDIKARKFFVSGNHEYYAESSNSDEDILGHISKAGFQIINSTSTVLGGVRIIGVDYDRDKNSSKDMIDIAYESFERDNMPSIVLKHVPLNIDKLEKEGASLVLSGHTHNGQILPFNILTKLIHKGYNYGLKNSGDTQVLVTSGVGTWGPVQRIGTNSEIVHITFKKAE